MKKNSNTNINACLDEWVVRELARVLARRDQDQTTETHEDRLARRVRLHRDVLQPDPKAHQQRYAVAG